MMIEIKEEKKCSKCGETKLFSEFYKSSSSKDGLNFYCKECCSSSGKKSYQKSKEKISINGKIYREKNKDHIKKVKAKRYIEVIKPNYHKNKHLIKPVRNSRYKSRIIDDPNFKIEKRLRNRTQVAIKKNCSPKGGKTTELLGCSVQEARNHIESKFLPGMSWCNYGNGGWNIDHIRPVSSFDLTDLDQQKKCFNYLNTQPLWESDNIKKGDTWEPRQEDTAPAE